jgi:hypothetical protein
MPAFDGWSIAAPGSSGGYAWAIIGTGGYMPEKHPTGQYAKRRIAELDAF